MTRRSSIAATERTSPARSALCDRKLEAYVIGDCLVGLTTEDINGEPIPGAATRWETSADGLTWTFHMRDHVWSDGVPVTAEDFVYSWRRILEPARGAPYAYYLWIVRNAHDVNTGKLPPSALGIVAKDDKTLVITLEHPAPYLPEWLMHQTTYPVPRHVLLAKGDAWSKVENYVANGPYVPKEWIPNDHVTLVKTRASTKRRTFVFKPSTTTRPRMWSQRSSCFAGRPRRAGAAAGRRDRLASQEYPGGYPAPSQPLQFVHHLQFPAGALQGSSLREAMNLAYDRETMTYKILKLGDPRPILSFRREPRTIRPAHLSISVQCRSWTGSGRLKP